VPQRDLTLSGTKTFQSAILARRLGQLATSLSGFFVTGRRDVPDLGGVPVRQRSGTPGGVAPRCRWVADARAHQPTFRELTMGRRSTLRRVEEFVLFDVLYKDGTRTSNRKVPGSELVDIDADRLAMTYIEAQDRQISEISGKPRGPIKSLTRVRRR
jgi:hypothetical protein